MIQAILEGGPRLPRELPFPLDRILNGCLARNRKSRINATQVLDLLEEAGVSSPQPRARTIEVAAEGGCEFVSITDALKTAKRGDRILVKPGAYRECLVIDRSVELLGDGPEEEIVIDGDGGCCAFIQAGQAVFRGITFRSFPGHGTTVEAPAVIQIERGRSIVERCRVLSGLQAGVSVRGATTVPIIRSCLFRDAKQAAIYVFERAKPIVADCAVSGSKRAGIWCADDGDPLVRNCDIVQGVMRGVLVSESGRGTFQGCRIVGNGGVGIEIAKNGNPLVQRCVINDNRGAAFELSRGAKGVVHECQLKGNANGAWVSHGANQVVRIDNCE
jgi:parallel beta-helix repeat protein